MALERLYRTLKQRKRPEDVAEMILPVLGESLSAADRGKLEKAAKGSLKNIVLGYTSMLQEFVGPIGAAKQVRKAIEIFEIENADGTAFDNPAEVEGFIKRIGPTINKEFGRNSYRADRLNREKRKAAGLDLSRRKYNKFFRVLRHLEKKLDRLTAEYKKFEFQQIGKHGFAHHIGFDEFSRDVYAACFVAYYTARCNLRSEFTIDGQQRPFDEIADVLFRKCLERDRETNWPMIAQVYPNQRVLNFLSGAEKGGLLGKWTSLLQDLAVFLKEIWDANTFRRDSMVVKRGDDSSTWNNTAAAWNKARDNWMNLIYAMGADFVLDEMCFGKLMRLMAADVVAWHRSAGNTLDPNTLVWSELPLPWEVFGGTRICTKETVLEACRKAGLDAEKSGWIAPRPHGVVEFRPTPELVHGVTVSNPFLATVLKKHKYFSGKNAVRVPPENN
ncbi:MAG: hypothetical protein JSS81_18920 [Acidobacteria bacterium]|nr:hypothetical protein [Acidobacteriota bacterium]